jgi:hypothetical protein
VVYFALDLGPPSEQRLDERFLLGGTGLGDALVVDADQDRAPARAGTALGPQRAAGAGLGGKDIQQRLPAFVILGGAGVESVTSPAGQVTSKEAVSM